MQKLSEIYKIASKGNNPFHDYLYWSDSEARKAQAQSWADGLAKAERDIKAAASSASDDRWQICFNIAEVLQRGYYRAYASERTRLDQEWQKAHPDKSWQDSPYKVDGGLVTSENSAVFRTWLSETFGIGRTSMYNYLEVYDTFAPTGSISAEAKYFKFWQLVELTSLSYEQRLAVQPNWTMEQIRAYKKSLKKRSESTERTDEKIEELVEDNSESSEQTDLKTRFSRLTRDALIDACVTYETEKQTMIRTIDALDIENRRLKAQLERKQGSASERELTQEDLDSIAEIDAIFSA